MSDSVGRYRIVRRLGAGGFGTVDLAEDTMLGRRVALKRIAGDTSDKLRSRLLREGKLAARLDHPNIARILDCIEDGTSLVLVFEYVEGETLGHRLRRQTTLPAPLARHVTLGLLNALEHAHALSVVHRDVKPDNIILTGDPAGDTPGVKLLDFGVGKSLDGLDREQLTQTGAAVGTLSFMSPEQACGLEVGPPADLYAVGATLYAMLRGEPPVRVKSLADLMRSLCDERPPSLSGVAGVDPELANFVDRALARDPGGRPASAASMREALLGRREPTVETAITSPAPMPTETMDLPVMTPAPAAPRRSVLPLAITGALAALVVGAWAATRPGPRPVVVQAEAAPPPPIALATSALPPPVLVVAPDAETSGTDDRGTGGGAPLSSSRRREMKEPGSWRIVLARPTGGEVDPAARRALEGGLVACLRRPELDAAANGLGRLVLKVGSDGSVEDARYLGFDDLASPPPEAASRRTRTRFDDLGQCLRRASMRRAVLRSGAEDGELIVTFEPR